MQCRSCGSANLILGARELNEAGGVPIPLLVVVGAVESRGFFALPRTQSLQVVADLCTDCGAVALRLENLQEARAWLDFLRRTAERERLGPEAEGRLTVTDPAGGNLSAGVDPGGLTDAKD